MVACHQGSHVHLLRMPVSLAVACYEGSFFDFPVYCCHAGSAVTAAAAAAAGIHLALFSWFWQSSPALAVAVGLNWGLGKLSIAKWGILLFLAFSDRMWLYFMYLAGKLVDRALAKLFPPVREFFWAMFTMWMLFVAVTPTYFYPLPFAPFAPGTMGAWEAVA